MYPLLGHSSTERLAKTPRDARLLELRAELAGQWSGSEAQVADYSAAIEALAHQTPEAAVDLKRLYRRRGNAYVGLKKWAAARRRLRPCRDRHDNGRGIVSQSGDGTRGGHARIAEMDRAQAGQSAIRAGCDLLPAS